MSVTKTLYLDLTRPFALREHGLKPQRDGDPGGNPYLLKTALQRRLYTVAPGWELSAPTLVTIQGDVIVMSGSLTIEGQAHGALGTGIIRHSSGGNAATDAQFLANAFKTASSDILPRCALLFGIGWYLKVIPTAWKDRVKSWDGLTDYLATVQKSWEDANADLLKAQAMLDAPREPEKVRRVS